MTGISRVDSGQASYAEREVIICGRPVHQPPPGTESIAGGVAPGTVILRQVCVLQAQEVKLGIAGGERLLAVIPPEGWKPAPLTRGDNRDPQQRRAYMETAFHTIHRPAIPSNRGCRTIPSNCTEV